MTTTSSTIAVTTYTYVLLLLLLKSINIGEYYIMTKKMLIGFTIIHMMIDRCILLLYPFSNTT